MYKIAASVAPSAELGEVLSIGSGSGQWTAATFPTAATAASSTKVTVAVVDSTNAVIASGNATVVSND